jgi:hypothetical protein
MAGRRGRCGEGVPSQVSFRASQASEEPSGRSQMRLGSDAEAQSFAPDGLFL